MKNESKERKSGVYVIDAGKGKMIAKYNDYVFRWFSLNPYSNVALKDSDLTVIDETEIFDQLKERDEMRELLTKIYHAQYDKTSSLANLNGLISQAQQFLNKTGE